MLEGLSIVDACLRIVVACRQAAQFFRSLVRKGACQYENGVMRWWLEAGLRLELAPIGAGASEWRLYVQRERGCGAGTSPRTDAPNTTEETT